MTSGTKRVKVDHFPVAAPRYGQGWAVVGVDVFRATTLLCTAAAAGRRCVVARDVAEATALAARIPGALLGGESSGAVPPGFDMGNSPAAMAARTDQHRTLVLTTSSGTPLLTGASGASAIFAASLRNVSAQVTHLGCVDLDVAVIGAGTRGQRREEDDLGCARIVAGLLAAGYSCDQETREFVDRYAALPTSWCATGRSADFLRRTGQEQDIDFVLDHDDDQTDVFEVRDQEIVPCATGELT